MFMKNNLITLSLILSIIGTFVSMYLLLIKLSPAFAVCGLSSCDVVSDSKYGSFIGIPNSIWGIAFYMGTFLLIAKNKLKLLLFSTFCGVLFSIYLTYIEAFVIHAFCQWCLLSAWISLALFVVSIRLAISSIAATHPQNDELSSAEDIA